MPAGHKIGELLIIVDLFLIGVTLVIASFGCFELFIGWIETSRGDQLPPWSQMRDFNDLKAGVVAMIVLAVAVDFIQMLVESSDGRQIMERGAGVALVIGALTPYVHFGVHGHDER